MSAQEQVQEATTATPTATPHPAKFSPAVFDAICDVLVEVRLAPGATVLDPFAGVGGVHDLRPDFATFAVEIEPEWATQAAGRGPTWCGDFLTLKPAVAGLSGPDPVLWPRLFDAVVTSPAYGNRMADCHQPSPADTSKRMTYRHQLGRPLTDGNTGGMQWGDEYRAFHRFAWRKVRGLLAPGGLFVLNVKDHVRGGKVQEVAAWHRDVIEQLGFEVAAERRVEVNGMGFGQHQNGEGKAKVDHEMVWAFRRTA